MRAKGETIAYDQLLNAWKAGRVSGDAYLDDYACVVEGLLALYRCTLDERWFAAARAFADDEAVTALLEPDEAG